MHAPAASTSLETPATVTTYDSTWLPAPVPTGDHSMRRRAVERQRPEALRRGRDHVGPDRPRRLDGVGEPDPVARLHADEHRVRLPVAGRGHRAGGRRARRGVEHLAAARVDERDLVSRDRRVVESARAEGHVEGAVAEAGDLRPGDGVGPVLHGDRDGAPRVPAGIVGGVGHLVLQRGVDRRGARGDVDGEGRPVGARLDRDAGRQAVVEPAHGDHAQRGRGERVRRPVVREHVDRGGAAARGDGEVGCGLRERARRRHHAQLDASGTTVARGIRDRDRDRLAGAGRRGLRRLDRELLAVECDVEALGLGLRSPGTRARRSRRDTGSP